MSSPLGQSIFGPILLLKPSDQGEVHVKVPQSLATQPTVWDCSTSPFQTDKKQKNDLYQNYQQETYPPNQFQKNQNIQNTQGKTLKSTQVENCHQSFRGLTNILKQVKLRNITKDDNFYCSCNQYQEYNINHVCIACQGKGNVDGTHNIVKFISFIMEFKLGNRGPYKTNYYLENQSNQQTQSHQLKQPSDLSLSNNNNKKQNKTIILQNKNNKQQTKINQFCSQFIKDEEQENSKQKAVNITNQTTIEQIQIINNQSISGINLGLNSIAQSVQNQIPNDGQKEKNLRMRDNEDGRKNQEMDEKQNTLTPFGKDVHECTEQCYQDYSSQNKNKKVRFRCPRKIKQQNNINEIEHQVPNTRSMVYQIGRQKMMDVRKSLPSSQPFMHLQQLTVKLSKQSKTHNQYYCDQCRVSPIEGSRYHCTSLMCKNNYDLCEKCYNKIGHRHKMKQIKYTQVNQLCQSLQRFSNKSIRSSMKFSGGIRVPPPIYNEHQIEEEDNENQSCKLIFKSSIH